MQTTATIAELACALAKAQGEFQNPERNRTVTVATKAGGSYSFTYATIDAVFNMARPILAKHGLSVIQCPSVGDSELIVTTRLMHASGEWIEEALAIKTASADPQALGSLVTYMKRYSYCAILGIAADEDDDGNAVSGNTVSEAKSREPNACPQCGKTASVIKGKEEYGGGWLCWKKKEGCGHSWQDAPAEPPKTNGSPAKTPYENALAVVEAADITGLPDAIAKIAAGQKLTVDEKIHLVNLAGERANTIGAGDQLGVVMKCVTDSLKELDHTFA
jgi:hypothetical protein